MPALFAVSIAEILFALAVTLFIKILLPREMTLPADNKFCPVNTTGVLTPTNNVVTSIPVIDGTSASDPLDTERMLPTSS